MKVFNYIKGTIVENGNNYVVIDNNGIGYQIYFFNPFSFYCDELQLSVECGYMDDSEGRKRLPHNVSFRWDSSLRCAEWFIELTEEEYYKKYAGDRSRSRGRGNSHYDKA